MEKVKEQNEQFIIIVLLVMGGVLLIFMVAYFVWVGEWMVVIFS